MTHLPRCPLSDLPRIMCDCCEELLKAEIEYGYLKHRTFADSLQPPRPTPRPRPGRPIPEYRSTPLAEPAEKRAGGGGAGNLCKACHESPAGDAYLCPGCVDQADRDLGDVPGLLDELQIHATGQSRFGGTGSGDGLPYAEKAAHLLDEIRTHLSTSIRVLTEERGLPVPALGTDTAAMSRWLLNRSAVLALDPAGPDIAADLRRWHTAALEAIDAPRERRYIGICQAEIGTLRERCATPLHAPAEAAEYHCPRCGHGYSVAACLDQISRRVRDVTATVAELVILARRDGRKITEKMVEGYVRRGRLQRVGRSAPARYRVGDLLGLLDERKAG